MIHDYVKRILTSRVYDVARETPLEAAPKLSGRLANRILLKREDLQPVFSFKVRGAYNKIAGLTEAARARGVVAASAGSHAQGVALAARRLQIEALIVMPRTTPEIKVESVRALEATVLLRGNNYDEACEVAKRKAREPYRIARECVDEVVTVSIDEICSAVKDVFDDTRSIAEPAGALALAGLKRYVARERVTGGTLVAVVSGANVNFDRLRQIGELADIGERREALLGVTIPERPGSFAEFCRVIGQRSITEFNYRCAESREAQVFVGVELRNGRSDKAGLIAHLRKHHYKVADLSDNEMAKLHVRYMVGGRAYATGNERLYRFEFPDHPGALLRFLTRMGKRWNISLFHYRNHGAAYGRVLAGIQVPAEDAHKLHTFLGELGYPFHEEANNPAYELFLGSASLQAPGSR